MNESESGIFGGQSTIPGDENSSAITAAPQTQTAAAANKNLKSSPCFNVGKI